MVYGDLSILGDQAQGYC